MFTAEHGVAGWRLGVLSLLILVGQTILIIRLFYVQVANSSTATARAEENSTIKVRLAPCRGEICDRSGIPLAENRPSFDIDLYLDELRRDFAKKNHGKVPRLVLKTREDGTPLVAEDDIVQIVQQSLEPIQQALGIQATLSEKDQHDIREHYRQDPDLPYHYMTDLDFATVARFAERNLGITGIQVAQSPVRQYTYGAMAAHLLGYVGRPHDQQDNLAPDGTPYDTIGLRGLENLMDDHLQGDPGYKVHRVTSRGYINDPSGKPLNQVDPTVGDTIYLTLDAHIQYIAETALRHSPYTRGCAIVMDPRNGDILALASAPSYDPNKFIPHIDVKTWKQWDNDPTSPLFNRCLHNFLPGSTYKIMVAVAGLKSGHVTADDAISSPAVIYYGNRAFHDSTRQDHGSYSLRDAICFSSDTYFYQYGNKAGIDAIDEMGNRAHFGKKWGILGDDEDDGILPGPAWMKKNSPLEHWTEAQTANVSIGQGAVLVTPLQMATFLCAVANGGTVYTPRIYDRAVNYKGDFDEQIAPGQVYGTLGVTHSQLQAVREGMLEVVQQGTGTAAQVPEVEVAGKTGTAQAYRRMDGARKEDLKGWFYCFAPFKEPRYVVCVMVEGATWGGTSAAPVAQEILKRLFAMEKGATESVAFLNPIQGNFDGVRDVEVHAEDQTADATPASPDTPAPSATSAIPTR